MMYIRKSCLGIFPTSKAKEEMHYLYYIKETKGKVSI